MVGRRSEDLEDHTYLADQDNTPAGRCLTATVGTTTCSPQSSVTGLFGAVMSMTISALNVSVVVSFFENGQLNLTKLFTLEDLNREQVDILLNFKGKAALIRC
jgi:hypothetical protein